MSKHNPKLVGMSLGSDTSAMSAAERACTPIAKQITAEEWMITPAASWRTSSVSANRLAAFVDTYMGSGALYTLNTWNTFWTACRENDHGHR